MKIEDLVTDYDIEVTGVGVKATHRPSGAFGESHDERTLTKNKRQALRRMTETPEFASWLKEQNKST